MARSFNGSTDYISLSASGILATVGGPWTISAWIYILVAPTSGNFVGLVTKRTISSGGANYELFLENVGGTVEFGAYNATNLPTSGNLSNNTWYNLVVACDSTSGIYYLNGSLSSTNSVNMAAGNAPTAPVVIGQDNNGGFFDGYIADAAIWNIKLTAGEAAALGFGARPGQIRPANLLGWWPLAGFASPEPDLSLLKNNGTLTGTQAAFGPPIAPFTRRMPQFTLVPPPTILTLMPQCVT